MSRDTTVIAFGQPDIIDDPLTELAREKGYPGERHCAGHHIGIGTLRVEIKMPTKTVPWDSSAALRNNEEIAAYIDACLTSALIGQMGRIEEGRVSGSS